MPIMTINLPYKFYDSPAEPYNENSNFDYYCTVSATCNGEEYSANLIISCDSHHEFNSKAGRIACEIFPRFDGFSEHKIETLRFVRK